MSQKNLLDGQLLWQYVELSNLEQSLLAKQIGTEPHQVGCYGDWYLKGLFYRTLLSFLLDPK